MKTPKLREGEDYYKEGDRYVLTATYHRKRGYCCGSRCRHCLYSPQEQAAAMCRQTRLAREQGHQPLET